MNTAPLITTHEAWSRNTRKAAIFGAAFGLIFSTVVHDWFERPVVADDRAVKMCQWPRHEGEAMSVIIVNGKTVCAELNR